MPLHGPRAAPSPSRWRTLRRAAYARRMVLVDPFVRHVGEHSHGQVAHVFVQSASPRQQPLVEGGRARAGEHTQEARDAPGVALVQQRIEHQAALLLARLERLARQPEAPIGWIASHQRDHVGRRGALLAVGPRRAAGAGQARAVGRGGQLRRSGRPSGLGARGLVSTARAASVVPAGVSPLDEVTPRDQATTGTHP
jgi:hypothetical protein